ncbi:acyl-CoA dehydrogenase family protein [Paenibacillus thermoaerophilus]|uniref:Acyl-CoA dehydrogenase family protein n=1 Tax=Paenibacillus thermoaerophilus TaxID=1215385 RepID=A0ABW2V5N8_9BACL|nr:acyl-CoA dehydrogenase family protein [Paenibacillus thermoaerophilus]TMV17162.1 acyl-CoA dehydrogenase [Paenibacillus thermoaerophilus]
MGAAGGGAFLLGDTSPEGVFTPEDFTEEHRMIAEMTEQFVEQEVRPHDDRLEAQDFTLLVGLLRKAGELGLLGADVPEEYGGSGLDKVASTLLTEKLVKAGSFALSHGAHTGIGSLPIVLFGTEEQKRRYVPDLVSGRKLAAYCLTEPSSGSDALGARTTAVLDEAGTHYTLNGTKQFITNAGFADLFIVYAKIDGKQFSAFIVEREYEGVSTGPEEKKMGIKGSSTRALILDNVRVPAENLLGEPGRGHVIAFNILNIGRYKLAAGCVGSSKWALQLAVEYARNRRQFGRPIADFPLLRQKMADVYARIYAAESMVYRTAGLIEGALSGLSGADAADAKQVARAIEEYALECSINKVYASECLDFAADEGVQIHGGYGYIQEYPIERIYRDSRINRIFEGTNEINRLLIPDTLLKRAMKGRLPLLETLERLQSELTEPRPEPDGTPLSEEGIMLQAGKRLFLLAGGTAVSRIPPDRLEQHQEVLASLADMAIAIYAAESAWLRSRKAAGRGDREEGVRLDAARLIVADTLETLEQKAKTVLAATLEGDALRVQLGIVRRLARFEPLNRVEVRRRIAARVVEEGGYVGS